MNRKKSLSQLIRRVYRSKPSLKTTTMNLIRASLPIVCLLGSSEVLAANARIIVNNNSGWNDTQNHPIKARGGHILDNRFNTNASADQRKFYMYGYNDNGGTNCYSSSDLANWTRESYSLPSAGSRPSVYLGIDPNDSSKTWYVLTGKGGQVYTSSTPCEGFILDTTGTDFSQPYTYMTDTANNGVVPSGSAHLRWLGDTNGSGGIQHNELLRDSSVFQDDGDPNKTFLVARTRRYCETFTGSGQWDICPNSPYTMNIYRMNNTGVNATSIMYREVFANASKEAPSLFTRGYGASKVYYMTASETRGWKASKTWYKKSAPGTGFGNLQNQPWIELSSDNLANLSYMTQHDFVMKISNNTAAVGQLPVRGTAGNYIFVGDRLADKCDDSATSSDLTCTSSFTDKYLIGISNSDYLANLDSYYHWMPVKFPNDDTPVMGGGIYNIPGLNNWCIDVKTGTSSTTCQ